MNRLNFFRTFLAAIGAIKAGKVEDVLPIEEITTNLPGIGLKSFNLWIGPGQFVMGDLFRAPMGNSIVQFWVRGRNSEGNLIAVSAETYLDNRTGVQEPIEVVLIEADNLLNYSKGVTRICNALPENSNHGEI